MNVFKKALVGAAVVATSFSAQAITSQFSFKVLSSGPNIYACNAGIKHLNTGEDAYDYGRGDDNVATTFTNTPGNYLADSFWYKFVELVEANYYAPTNLEGGHKRADGSDRYVLANADVPYRLKNAVKALNAHRTEGGWVDGNPKALGGLQFELSSEIYGAEYFVDICYTGSRDQADHFTPGLILAANASVSFADLEGTFQDTNNGNYTGVLKYNELAGLSMKATLICSEQGVITTKVKFREETVSNLNTVNVFENVQVARISQSGANSGNDGHKCMVRYSFKENSGKIRVNKLHGLKVLLDTRITDPAL